MMKTAAKATGVVLLVLAAVVACLVWFRLGSVFRLHHLMQSWLADDIGIRPSFALLGALLGDAILVVSFWSLLRLAIFGTVSPRALGLGASLLAAFASITLFGETNYPQPIAAERPLFKRDGQANAWCAFEAARHECFDMPGHHPQTGVRLEPVTPAVARQVEAERRAQKSAAALGEFDGRTEPQATVVVATASAADSVSVRAPAVSEPVIVSPPAPRYPVYPVGDYPRVRFEVVGVSRYADRVEVELRYRNRTAATVYLSHAGNSPECGDGAKLRDAAGNDYVCRRGLGQIADGRGLELPAGSSATHVFVFEAPAGASPASGALAMRLPHTLSEFGQTQGYRGTFGYQPQTVPAPIAVYPLAFADVSPR